MKQLVEVSKPAKVLEGLDGWLYLDHDANRSVDQYIGRFVIPDTALAAWRVHFDRIAELRESLGFRFVQVFAPSKESVYGSWYPHRDTRAAVRPIDSVLGVVPPSLSVLYPVRELTPRMGDAVTYDKGDTHWNDLGATIVADLTLRTLGRDGLDLSSFHFGVRSGYGDLDSKIPGRPPGELIEMDRINPDIVVTFDSNLINRGRVVVMHNLKVSDGCAVIFGDSFASILRRPLAHAFRRIVLVHGNSVDAEFLRVEKPDVVIAEMAERFVTLPPRDPEVFRIVDLLLVKLRREPASERERLRAYYETKINGSERHLAELFMQALASLEQQGDFEERDLTDIKRTTRSDRDQLLQSARDERVAHQRAIRAASTLLRNQDFADALATLDPCLQGPYRSTALRLKMLTLMRTDLAACEEVLRALIAENGDRAEFRTNLALSLLAQRRRPEAVLEARAGVGLDPRRVSSRSRLISILRNMRRTDEAIQVLHEGLALDPHDSTLLRIKADLKTSQAQEAAF